MPRVTQESIDRRNKKRRDDRARAKRPIPKSSLPAYKIAARRMMPRLPANTSKADLRAMLAEAAANTK